MRKLVAVRKREDILPEYLDTPVGLLLEYHNLGRTHQHYDKAPLLVGMCIDHRKYLRIPPDFAYIIRTAGGNLRYTEFCISYGLAVGRATAIALIAHNDCGMVNLAAKKEQFIEGLVEHVGWEREYARDHFNHFVMMHEIENATDFVVREAGRLNLRYPKTLVAPLYYNIEDHMLYQVLE